MNNHFCENHNDFAYVYIEFFFYFSFFIRIGYSSGVYFRIIFPFICQKKILLLFSLFTKILYRKSFYLKEFFSKIKFYLYFLKYRKVMHIQLSNKVLNTVMQKQSIVRIFIFTMIFIFWQYIKNHLHRA